jgi:hypothetical protein
MKKELKDRIEGLVVSSIKDFKAENGLNPKRIVLCTSIKLLNETLVFNHTQNRFYNQQFMIDHRIPVEIISYYKQERHGKEGDYVVDLGAFLKDKPVKRSAFTNF